MEKFLVQFMVFCLLNTILLIGLCINNFLTQRKKTQSEADAAIKKVIEETRNTNQEKIILSIIQILELHDPYTKGHSENVARYSEAIAKALKPDCDPNWFRSVYWAGMTHDVGKILVPAVVLNKPTRLNAKEFELIKMHPVWGAKVISTSDDMSHIAQSVLHHHEHYDGRGYPDRMKGDAIPLVSRIIAVADAYDTMTSRRVYRKRLSFAQAMEQLQNDAGAQFDPEIVSCFLSLLTKPQDTLKKQAG